MKDLRISERLTIPASQLDVQQVRSGGPGGQNVNKVATKIVLTWPIDVELLGSSIVASRLRILAGQRLTKNDEIQITSQETRSADQNLKEALQRLRHLLLQAFVKPKPRIPTKPSKGSKRRRLDDKQRSGQRKSDRQQRWDNG